MTATWIHITCVHCFVINTLISCLLFNFFDNCIYKTHEQQHVTSQALIVSSPMQFVVEFAESQLRINNDTYQQRNKL